eukprot:10166012-Alexandrium_andersonii.AAC.1
MAHWESLMISSSVLVRSPENPRSASKMAASSALLLVGRSARAMAPGSCLTSTAAQPSLTSLDWAVRPMNTAAPAATPEWGLKEPSVQAVSLRRGSPACPGSRARASLETSRMDRPASSANCRNGTALPIARRTVAPSA